MNKEEWLNIKKSQTIPMELFYEFYKIKNIRDTEMNPLEFRDNFQHYVYFIGVIPTKAIVEYYDRQFGITKLLNIIGEIIKEY